MCFMSRRPVTTAFDWPCHARGSIPARSNGFCVVEFYHLPVIDIGTERFFNSGQVSQIRALAIKEAMRFAGPGASFVGIEGMGGKLGSN
jgi:hypothetical protein